MEEPLSYEPAKKQTVEKMTKEIVIDHLVESLGTGVQGLICDVHLVMADCLPERTKSGECKYLAELFARAVDAPKTGEIIPLDEVYKFQATYCNKYPEFMRKYDQPIRDSTNILNKLFRKASAQLYGYSIRTAPDVHPKCHTMQNKARARDEQFEQWLESHGLPLPILLDSENNSSPKSEMNTSNCK